MSEASEPSDSETFDKQDDKDTDFNVDDYKEMDSDDSFMELPENNVKINTQFIADFDKTCTYIFYVFLHKNKNVYISGENIYNLKLRKICVAQNSNEYILSKSKMSRLNQRHLL